MNTNGDQRELQIQLLGGFAVRVCGEIIPEERWHSHRARNLVKLLALATGHRLHRDQIIDVLWPDSDLAASTNNFHQTLHTARQILSPAGLACLVLEDGHLFLLNPVLSASGLCVDVEQFEDAASRAKDCLNPNNYRAALSAYPGDLLPDDLFEEWVAPRREALHQVYLKLLLDFAQLLETSQEYAAGIDIILQLLSADSSHEAAHAALMRLYALNGQRQQALRQYQTLREALNKDLDAEPSESTTQLYKAIQSGSFAPTGSSPNPNMANPPRHNLPAELTSFVGREKEIKALKQLVLANQTRLVTVTGSGGTGKTRLALHMAKDLLYAFPDGIWLIDLAALTDPDLVPATVASILKQTESPNKSITQVLVDFLRSKRILLLLDNCEHLINAVASLVECILRDCPRASFLITSREILGASGEIPFRCPSLALPDANFFQQHAEIEPVPALIACESVRLFAERAALAAPGFALIETNVPVVAQVCRRLDGIPLAIELAAARTRILSLAQISDRLDHAFRLLTGGSRTALPRQQTLKATIDWSYNLLSPIERLLLLRLSIFFGGWTLEAAEAVCSDENIPPEEILDLLGRLVDKSLIQVEPVENLEPRYRMLETIRQYSRDRLLESGGDTAVRDRHLGYFLQFAEEAETHMRATGMTEWLKRAELDLDNLRLALEWSLSNSVEQGLRIATALMMFWHIRSRRFEGIQWLGRLLDANAAECVQPCSSAQKILRGRALIVSGNLNHYYPGIFQENAKLHIHEARLIFEALGDEAQKYLPFAMFYLSTTPEDRENCLAMARKVGDDFHAAECLLWKGFYASSQGNFHQARLIFEENPALRRKIGDMDGEAFGLHEEAEMEYFQGHPEQALQLWETSQALFKEVGNLEFGGVFSCLPIEILFTQGRYQQALQLGEAVLAAGQEISSSLVVVEALGQLGRAYWALQKYADAASRCEEIVRPDWKGQLPCGTGGLYYALGRVALSSGDTTRACAYLKRYQEMETSIGFLSIQALGIIAAAQGQARRAVVIFGVVERLCSWLGNVASPAERAEYEQALVSTRAALSDADFQSAWNEGGAMTIEQVDSFILAGMEDV